MLTKKAERTTVRVHFERRKKTKSSIRFDIITWYPIWITMYKCLCIFTKLFFPSFHDILALNTNVDS